MSQKVIDVSHHNGRVDWEKVKSAGYHAIIRLGYGQEIASQRDKQAVRNVQECERLGIPYGLYLYSYADGKTKALGEAEHALHFVKEFCGPNFLYPCFVDIEERNLLRYATTVADTFCKKLETCDVTCGVYASESVWLSQLKDFESFYKWVAKWSDKAPEVAGVDLWQFTDRASVPGVSGVCDASYSYVHLSAESQKPVVNPSAYEIALDVIAGKYGNGETRKVMLGSDYERVQALVNYMLTLLPSAMKKIVDLVVAGAYGNGEERKKQLGRLYDEVQKAVNARLK